MGFNPIKAVTGVLGGILGGAKPKAAATTPAAAVGGTADDVAKEEERRRLLARGLTPLTATTPLGDTSAANIGRKALLGI